MQYSSYLSYIYSFRCSKYSSGYNLKPCVCGLPSSLYHPIPLFSGMCFCFQLLISSYMLSCFVLAVVVIFLVSAISCWTCAVLAALWHHRDPGYLSVAVEVFSYLQCPTLYFLEHKEDLFVLLLYCLLACLCTTLHTWYPLDWSYKQL